MTSRVEKLIRERYDSQKNQQTPIENLQVGQLAILDWSTVEDDMAEDLSLVLVLGRSKNTIIAQLLAVEVFCDDLPIVINIKSEQVVVPW